MSDPWGVEQPAAVAGELAPLPSRLARLAALPTGAAVPGTGDPYAVDHPVARELPEVQALERVGFRVLDGAPLHCLLPAAWPAEHRAWVPDRLPRVAVDRSGTYGVEITVTAVRNDSDLHEWVATEAAAAGLPAPPSDRIWLLRSPWPRLSVAVVDAVIWRIVSCAAGRDNAYNEIQAVYRVASDVLTWDETRVMDRCPRRVRELVEAWAAAGRVGEAAAEVIDSRLAPAVVEAATASTGLDEPTLLAWLDSLDGEPDAAALKFIRAWRSAGLPGDPPPAAGRFRGRRPAELRRWIDAGFDLYAAERLRYAGLATVRRWREAGFGVAETYDLLRADPTLTIDEARAFESVGAAMHRRRDWVYEGFDADQAAAWTAVGLTPEQASLWRRFGRTERDVRSGQRLPPEVLVNRRDAYSENAGLNDATSAGSNSAADPPGTRGRGPRRRSGDPDPWINSD